MKTKLKKKQAKKPKPNLKTKKSLKNKTKPLNDEQVY